MNLGSQEEVLRFLQASSSHDNAVVRRIDTHAASVFLAGDRALKVKRAVRFPFLDYSSLEKRREACIAELDVNRPFAPQLYLGVRPITREADDRLAIDGSGNPVEWAVEMRRFNEERTLDRLAERGEIDGELADQLGRVVAAHARVPAVEPGHGSRHSAPILTRIEMSWPRGQIYSIAVKPELSGSQADRRWRDSSRCCNRVEASG
jgi:uncharacterized protein